MRPGRAGSPAGRRAGVGGRLPSATTRRSLRLAVARHRRLLAAGATAAAVAATVHGLTPAPPPVRAVWVAARDLPAGHRLAGGDLRRAALPPAAVPDGVTDGADGEVLAAPLRRGEPVTDVRLLGPGLLAGRPPGTVAVTVRLADPVATVAVRPGSRVDVLALPVAGAQGWQPEDGSTLVAPDALVLALPGASGPGEGGGTASGSGGGSGGGLLGGSAGSVGSIGSVGSGPFDPAGSTAGVLLLAVDRATASALAAAQAVRSLTVVMG